MVRKPISEMREEAEDEPDDSESTIDFEAFSADDREEANELFEFLLSNGWITHSSYSLESVPGPDGNTRKSVSLNVYLPSSLDIDPQEYNDG